MILGIIVYNWVREIIHPTIGLDLNSVKKYRFFVLLLLIWSFWYSIYVYGQGFVFTVKDLLLSYYGLMPCPATIVVLSLLTLKYPAGNRKLFNLLTIYAIIIGTSTVATGWLPDIPFITLGIYSLVLILFNKKRES
ncbi:MAG: hypothetical protein JXQ30_02680 [Spirochaetes bacterium]|nr:hypothetical protein [Spirochaetota bacterium]